MKICVLCVFMKSYHLIAEIFNLYYECLEIKYCFNLNSISYHYHGLFNKNCLQKFISLETINSDNSLSHKTRHCFKIQDNISKMKIK